MERAVFNFRYNGEFSFGYYVVQAGNPTRGGYLHEVFNELTSNQFYSIGMIERMKRLTALIQVRETLTDPKNPFSGQLSKKGEPIPPLDLFWFNRMSEIKLLTKYGIYPQTTYDIRFLKNSFHIKVNYNNEEMTWRVNYKKLDYQELLNDIVKWSADIDAKLADCDCLK